MALTRPQLRQIVEDAKADLDAAQARVEAALVAHDAAKREMDAAEANLAEAKRVVGQLRDLRRRRFSDTDI